MARKKTTTATAPLYSLHPSIAYRQAVLANLTKTTGKSIEDWTRVVNQSRKSDEQGCYERVKGQHKLGGTTASVIAQKARGTSSDVTDPVAYMRAAPQWVESMYGGPKSELRPIHDALIELGL